MESVLNLRTFYFYLILICCFMEINGRGGRGGRGGSRGGRGGGGYSGRGSSSSSSYSGGSYGSSSGASYGSKSSSSSGVNSGNTNHGAESKAFSHSSSSGDNVRTGRIGHNLNGNNDNFDDRRHSATNYNYDSSYKYNKRPQIDWESENKKIQEKQRELDEMFERSKNMKIISGDFNTHRYRSTYEDPYDIHVKSVLKEDQRLLTEAARSNLHNPYIHKADIYNKPDTFPSQSLGKQEVKRGRYRNSFSKDSRRTTTGKCHVRKLTNDQSISWVCTRMKGKKTCTIKCIEPKRFSGIAAENKYTCTDGIWTPSYVPSCI